MKLIPTTEQQTIITAGKTGANLAISAFAGASKTTTCIMLAEELKQNSLYIAFNKSIADEAKTKFPAHVECRTLHSLAYEAIIKPNFKMKKKLNGFFVTKELRDLLPELDFLSNDKAIKVLNVIIELITKFCQSDKKDFKDFLESLEESIDDFDYNVMQYLPYLEKVWNNLVDQNTDTKITHDVYLKLFHLQEPNFRWYKTIYLDEAQDSNPVTLDIVLNAARKGSQVIIVGDKHQAIYEWRGAINAFDSIPDNFINLNLTQSFRFGSNIAGKANAILKTLGCEIDVIGSGNRRTVSSYAVLTRTNAGLFGYLVESAMRGEKVFVIGDLKEVFNAMYTANNIKFNGDRSKRFHKQIASYETWKELLEAAEHNMEIAKIINLLNIYPNVHEAVTLAKKAITEDLAKASYTLCTIHKSKGLEWDEVTIADDLYNDNTDSFDMEEWLLDGQNGNLAYVGITRAKVRVNAPYLLNVFIGEML